MRSASITRKTNETEVSVSIVLEGSGDGEIDTGIGFFDHALSQVAKHGLFDMEVSARGDLEVDGHHTVEDVGIVLGQALAEAVGDGTGLVRYGLAMCPMDEALVRVAIDFGGRGYSAINLNPPAQRMGEFASELVPEFFRAVAANAKLALHIDQLSGDNTHHIFEGTFKSFARALDEATQIDCRCEDVPSTKGTV